MTTVVECEEISNLLAGSPRHDFDELSLDMDAWLETQAGRKWLADMEEQHYMANAAECYGQRPGLTN